MAGLSHALKEWAVICRALAVGRQSLVLRKGGIAEDAGSFRVEHTRFWLYPTYLHQKSEALKPEAHELLTAVRTDRPPQGVVRLSHWAEVDGIYQLHNLVAALKLNDLHLWSMRTVQERFAYRSPGLCALLLRVRKVPQPIEIAETPRYAGCKSWVELEHEQSIEGSTPVLSDDAFRGLVITLEDLLNPTAFA
jgi:hypothetical protein